MEYLGRLKGIADQLGVAGYVVSDKEKVEQTLSSLGLDFYAFTTALEVLPILATFNELQGKLLQHEMNMKQLMGETKQGGSLKSHPHDEIGSSHITQIEGNKELVPAMKEGENNASCRFSGQVYTRQKRRGDGNLTTSHVEVHDQPVRSVEKKAEVVQAAVSATEAVPAASGGIGGGAPVHRARPVDLEFVARGVLKGFVSAPQVWRHSRQIHA
ncbi:hypothetical protein EJ110_NYTH35328 [Nymphaea thermarum]|nr:hypothetical protein EJ110_NYTH35328 [Nymphaea thermarum]